jgi:hypothetical protein
MESIRRIARNSDSKGKKQETYMSEVLWRERKRIWCGLPWTFTKYQFTKDKFTIESGLFTKIEDEVRLYRITDITLKQTFMQRIFGIGSIICSSSDRTSGNFIIENIKNSREVKETLSDLIEKARKENRVFSREDLGYGDSDYDVDNN